MARPKLTAHQVRQALYGHFTRTSWAVVFEVTARAEGSLRDKLAAVGGDQDAIQAVRDGHHDRRIDALLVRRARPRKPTAAQMAAEWRRAAAERQRKRDSIPDALSALFEVDELTPPVGDTRTDVRPDVDDNGGLERVAIEIKVSRGDFLADVRNPGKQAPWRELAERHAYCVPEGLVMQHEVPAGSGLLVVTAANLAVSWARRAPRTTAARPLPIANQLDAFYRWARAEAIVQGLDWEARQRGEVDDETLRAELARLRHENELLNKRNDRLNDQVGEWKRRYATVDPPPCSTCGKPLRPTRGGMYSWQHNEDDEVDCRALRTEQALKAEEQKPERLRLRTPCVSGPEPEYPEDRLVDNPDTTACVLSA